MKNTILCLSVILLSACTWVKLTDAGSTVALVESDEVSQCEFKGRITAISRAKVAGVSRKEQKLALELSTIARNQATDMGGNAVSPASEITGNEQKFGVYACP